MTIPKPGGGERPLGIPTIRDRVAQTAAKLVLEPIFEADFEDSVYGYRPSEARAMRSAECTGIFCRGIRDVVDADLSKYFDTIPHRDLMQAVARRIVDRHVLHLIKMWLEAPVEERDEDGPRRMRSGKSERRGTPQGGVVSPLLANLYMNRFLKHWRLSGRGEAFQAQVVAYADDFVILSRARAAEALAWTKAMMTKLGLTLNETKTSLRDARTERFDFLGYTFGPHHRTKDGRSYSGASPSKKSVHRIKTKIGENTKALERGPVDENPQKLNRLLLGWSAYFGYGSRAKAYRAVDHYVVDTSAPSSPGGARCKTGARETSPVRPIYGELEVVSLWKPHPSPAPKACREACRKAGCGKSARPV